MCVVTSTDRSVLLKEVHTAVMGCLQANVFPSVCASRVNDGNYVFVLDKCVLPQLLNSIHPKAAAPDVLP